MRLIILFSFVLVFISCEKSDQYRQSVKFQEMLDHLELDCPDEDSDAYFEAIIHNQSTCYKNGIDGMLSSYRYQISFTTQSSSFITGADYQLNGRIISFGIRPDTAAQYQDWVVFSTPLFPLKVSAERYLDSLFSIENHLVTDRNERQGITVTLYMMDLFKSGNPGGGITYPLSSKYGYQKENSFLKFTEVTKGIQLGKTYYDIVMEVQCGLYFYKDRDGYTQYGKEGLWGNLKNGELRMRIVL